MRKTRLISNGLRKYASGHFHCPLEVSKCHRSFVVLATNADHHLPLFQTICNVVLFYIKQHRRQLNQPTTDSGNTEADFAGSGINVETTARPHFLAPQCTHVGWLWFSIFF
jgi:hypothetical protein